MTKRLQSTPDEEARYPDSPEAIRRRLNAPPDLIARLEGATESSRELDAFICWMVNPHPQGSAGPDWWLLPQGTQQHVPTISPHYTTSLDAALTLVPPECSSWELDWNGHSGALHGKACCATIYLTGSSTQYNGDAPTPALALCIAALKARETVLTI